MDDNKLRELKNKVEKAEKIKVVINNINEIIKNIKKGKCKNIEYEYYAPTNGSSFQMDYEGEGNYCYTQSITFKTLGISEEEYNEWFSVPLENYILKLKEKLQKDYDELQI